MNHFGFDLKKKKMDGSDDVPKLLWNKSHQKKKNNH
jgi:hypothetical protein